MVDWDAIDNVFLDMDGTLLDLHFDNYFWLEHLPQRYAETYGKDPLKVREDLRSKYRKMKGTLDWYCLEYWQIELRLDIVQLKRELMGKIRFRPNADYLLTELKKMGKHVALVSNAHRWSIELKAESVLPMDKFNAVHSSHDFGYPKEEQRFWMDLQHAAGFDIGRTLFIDDNVQVLESAERFGIGHLLAIHQPDLQAEPVVAGKFRQIKDFKDLV